MDTPGVAGRRMQLRAPSSNEADANGAGTVGLSIVVPTKNEAGNVTLLVDRIERALAWLPLTHLPAEVIFVDDSDDDTAAAIASIRSSIPVRLIHRRREERTGGLGGAVVVGIRASRAPWVCVMDGDLQHPPEVLEQMVRASNANGADLVVASRFCHGGDVGNFSRLRTRLSRACSRTAALLFMRRLREVSDPLSGYFLVRRKALRLARLRPQGFKILLEILVRTPQLRISEVPFRFGDRHAGETKASAQEGLRFLGHLVRLRLGDLPARFGRFGVVGATGLVVNMILLAVLTDVAGLYYVAGAILATQGSTLWNFVLTELWVFSDRDHARSGLRRMAMYFSVNNAALLLRVPMLFALTTGLGVNYLVSNLVSLLGITLLRFVLADVWIWAGGAEEPVLHCYDIHGIVTVASEVALPELERFATGELLDQPRILVRIGDLPESDSTDLSANGRHARDNGVAAHLAPLNGAGPNGSGPNGHGPAPIEHPTSIRYTEAFGRYGFAVEITETATGTEVVASPLLRRSPHVLYTNVVEPVLRWTFAGLGYALVHAACFADGERAYFITARTDTGKTTTMLKILDASPNYSFISDDLTLVAPDGRVLAYPKPLTISRHTVKAVSTPLLSRSERMALVVQSRLHSRAGRRFALLIAKLHIPAATLNAVTQLVVPPPKYHVERLVPGAQIAPEARLAGLAVIERGGVGEIELESEEALQILLSNCEDAYGFPPYSSIEHFLHSRNGDNLKQAEREIIAGAVRDLPSTVFRSETMDWWLRVPAMVNGNGTSPSAAKTGALRPIRP